MPIAEINRLPQTLQHEPGSRVSMALTYRTDLLLGSRRVFVLRVLSSTGAYPHIRFAPPDALYIATKPLVYTCVPTDPVNDDYSEIGWNELGEIRLWGALALSIREGQGFYRFVPGAQSAKTLYVRNLTEATAGKVAERIAAVLPIQEYELDSGVPSAAEIEMLYAALLRANVVLLRGVNSFLKALAIWSLRESWMLLEEMAVNLHIALEAALSVLRGRLSAGGGADVSFEAVYTFISGSFRHGDALVEFWRDRRHDRNLLLHPDSHTGAQAIVPLCADDVFELLDPMLSLYRYLLVADKRPR